MKSYYNEIDPFAADWLRELIRTGAIHSGDVDTRSIAEVEASDLAGYGSCHFFAGIGGWPLALRLAGWPDSAPIWTGSCPCQPFSVAGNQKGFADERHLWPEFYRLIRQRTPDVVMGEQVAGASAYDWSKRLSSDFQKSGYNCGILVAAASAFGAPQKRERQYFGAHLAVADAKRRTADVWRNRRVEAVEACAWPPPPWEQGDADFGFVDDGLPGNMVKSILRGLGNAIIPQVAAPIAASFFDAIAEMSRPA